MRRLSPEKDRSERYLLTYADLMNLLLILFIVLFCNSSQDVVKTSAVMQAIKEGFAGGGASSYSASAVSSKGKGSGNVSNGSSGTDYSDFYAQLIAVMRQRGILDKVSIIAKDNEVIISLKDNVLFAPGKDDLNSDAVSLLVTMGNLIKKLQYGQLVVEGHTDSDPIHTAQFENNRELSLFRAYRVSQIFENDCNMNSKKILPVGYGADFPVAPNTTAANKAKNRRVVISILRRGITPADETVTKAQLSSALSTSSSSSASKASGASSSISSKTSSSTSSSK